MEMKEDTMAGITIMITIAIIEKEIIGLSLLLNHKITFLQFVKNDNKDTQEDLK